MATTTVSRATRARRRNRTSVGFIGSSILVWIYAAMLAVPIYYVVVSAFKTNNEIFAAPFKPTFTAGFDHYTDIWDRLDIGRGLINSTYITLAALVLTLVLAVPASYALARSTGRVAAMVERLFALGFLIPAFAALVPTLLLAIEIGLFQKREFMILYMPASAQPLTVIILTQFMRTVPVSLYESAVIDGAGPLRILRNIYMPLTMPGIATVTILNFIGFWNDYLFMLVIVGPNPAVRTIQVALPLLNTNQGITDYALIAAATVFSVLPVFVVYAVLNRRMEDALVTGAIKG
jgi:multiple sugar transport system permease protein